MFLYVYCKFIIHRGEKYGFQKVGRGINFFLKHEIVKCIMSRGSQQIAKIESSVLKPNQKSVEPNLFYGAVVRNFDSGVKIV